MNIIYNKLRQKAMVKAIKTRNLNTILRTAEYLNFKKVLNIIRSKKFNHISSYQLDKLNTVIIKGDKSWE